MRGLVFRYFCIQITPDKKLKKIPESYLDFSKNITTEYLRNILFSYAQHIGDQHKRIEKLENELQKPKEVKKFSFFKRR